MRGVWLIWLIHELLLLFHVAEAAADWPWLSQAEKLFRTNGLSVAVKDPKPTALKQCLHPQNMWFVHADVGLWSELVAWWRTEPLRKYHTDLCSYGCISKSLDVPPNGCNWTWPTCKGALQRKLHLLHHLLHFCVLVSFIFSELHRLAAAADGQEMTHYQEEGKASSLWSVSEKNDCECESTVLSLETVKLCLSCRQARPPLLLFLSSDVRLRLQY